ncbi:hypothetical protein ABVT39_009743 [Epinephelus coioides]
MDKYWLKNMKTSLNFRTTLDLESFQNHILMYAGKRFAYSPPVYEARTLLAAIDYSYHNNRPAALNSEGNKMNKRHDNKKTKTWSAYTVKTPKTYSYIPELQRRIFTQRLTSGKGLPKTRSLRPDDPRTLGLLAEVPPPSTAEIVHARSNKERDCSSTWSCGNDVLLVYLHEPSRYEACVLSMNIRKSVTDSPHHTTGNNNPVPFTQPPILPKDVLSVSCMSVLALLDARLLVIIDCKDVIPGSAGKLQHTLIQNIQIHEC